MEPTERFAYNLTQARQAIGLSQEELGFRSGLHRTEISSLERACREPRLTTLIKLATPLDWTPNELCEGIKWLPDERRFEISPPPRAD